MAVGTRCADHVTPFYPQKLALTSPTGVGRSVGIVLSRTKATEFSLVLVSRPILYTSKHTCIQLAWNLNTPSDLQFLNVLKEVGVTPSVNLTNGTQA